jgi:hypothetical protein
MGGVLALIDGVIPVGNLNIERRSEADVFDREDAPSSVGLHW